MLVQELHTTRSIEPAKTINMGIPNSTVTVNGNLTATNTVSGKYIKGDGYLITNLSTTAGTGIGNGTSNVRIVANSNIAMSVAGNANIFTVTGTGANVAGTLNTTGNTTITGNLVVSTNANVTGTFRVTANSNVSNLGASGNITASYFLGNGSQLTGISTIGTGLVNGNSNVTVAANGNVTVSATGTANVLTVASTVIVPAANVIPSGNNAQTLGNATNRFGTIYGSQSAIAGTVVQIQNAVSGPARQTITSTSAVAVTGLSVTFTPKYSNSIILIEADICGSHTYVNSYGIYRDAAATVSSTGQTNNNEPNMQATQYIGTSSNDLIYSVALRHYETSANTSARTYAVYCTSGWSGAAYSTYINNRASNDMAGFSYMTVTEIAQ